MNRFTKNERLRSRKQIEALLTGGESFFVYPFRVVYGYDGMENGKWKMENEESKGDNNFQFSTFNSQFLIAVPKRKIKKAVLRNLVKRRTREAWRLNKQELQVTSDKVMENGKWKMENEELNQAGKNNSQFLILNSQSSSLVTRHLSLSVILQYVADEPLPYTQIAEAVKTIIRKLNEFKSINS